MFGDLERQRDDLTAAVTALRNFETAYRTNLATHLRKQIESLESAESSRSMCRTWHVQPRTTQMGLLVSRAESISLSAKMLQALAEVVPATPHVSTLFWGTSAGRLRH